MRQLSAFEWIYLNEEFYLNTGKDSGADLLNSLRLARLWEQGINKVSMAYDKFASVLHVAEMISFGGAYAIVVTQ